MSNQHPESKHTPAWVNKKLSALCVSYHRLSVLINPCPFEIAALLGFNIAIKYGISPVTLCSATQSGLQIAV